MKRLTILLFLLLLTGLAGAQIGGYFELGSTPSTVWEGDSFEVEVILEMAAREELRLHVSADDLSISTRELVIAKGRKTAVFTVTAPLLPVNYNRQPQSYVGRFKVSNRKNEHERYVTITPRYSRNPNPIR
ncbi:hypothetical protein DYH09_09165 [bacterium CPR1]|nr:hypothetical protein [bacterium CPR1]